MATARGSKFKIVIDTREQEGKGWDFRASANCSGTERRKLDVGDYAIKGMEHIICIERKTLGDLWNTLSMQNNYDRFLREWDRAKDHRMKFLVIEAKLSDVQKGYAYSKVSPNNIMAKLTSLQVKHNVHVIFAGRKDVARKYVRGLMAKLYKYYLDGVIKDPNNVKNI